MNAGLTNGMVIQRNVYDVSAPRFVEASSMDGSIWIKDATPASIATGISLNMKQRTIIAAVPVNNNGGWLKAKI